MSSPTITPAKERALQERMKRLGISEDDIRETFIRSSGPGGQKVNKTSSGVYLVHLPTGLSVKCQQSRSQAVNRFLARRLLADRIERIQKGVVEAERMRVEKIRRQKKRRSRRAKEKILQEKHLKSEKKTLRSKVELDE
ncbi:MAG TPA: peptide chain release factor-like protein [Syntrophales bacterium]|nr:peptide chain release factor-like protein [Syntrophales bacterium]HRT69860.1 peptide chain release factor-like protein [Syntrophales bacterium]